MKKIGALILFLGLYFSLKQVLFNFKLKEISDNWKPAEATLISVFKDYEIRDYSDLDTEKGYNIGIEYSFIVNDGIKIKYTNNQARIQGFQDYIRGYQWFVDLYSTAFDIYIYDKYLLFWRTWDPNEEEVKNHLISHYPQLLTQSFQIKYNPQNPYESLIFYDFSFNDYLTLWFFTPFFGAYLIFRNKE